MPQYENYQYLWPPRPEVAVPPTQLGEFEKMNWWAQAKLDGDCCVIAVPPEGDIIVRTRHGDSPFASSRYQPGQRIADLADRLPADTGWYYFVVELLENRGVGIKDTLFLHDILVADNQYLVGRSYRDRLRLLYGLFGVPFAVRAGPPGLGEDWSHVASGSAGVWLARCWRTGFKSLWSQRPGKWVEGLVLKNPDAALAYCVRQGSNSSWQAKCRYPNKVVAF